MLESEGEEGSVRKILRKSAPIWQKAALCRPKNWYTMDILLVFSPIHLSSCTLMELLHDTIKTMPQEAKGCVYSLALGPQTPLQLAVED